MQRRDAGTGSNTCMGLVEAVGHGPSLRSPADPPVGVLIVEADAAQRRALAAIIAERSDGRFVATACASPEEALGAAGRCLGREIMIADLDTVGGPSRLSEIAGPSRPLIALSANGSLATAIAAMKGGASDFLAKPVGARALIERLDAALASRGLRPEPTAAPNATKPPAAPANLASADFAGFIGRSPAMQAVYAQITRMAPSRVPVFITGESGTGKELCAEALHAFACEPGGRARPFVAINCSAIPRDLMESEIFGHVRGAFTGAAENRAGAAEIANGGTLFLDEVAEMDLGLQAKLLRFLQTGSFRRVGGSEVKRVDVRILCATNREPLAEVAAGRFRADLFYRLHVLPIHLPPLRERGEDVIALARTFLARFAAEEGRAFAGFDAAAAGLLSAYGWPGNVRELANVIRRIVVLDDGAVVTAPMLPETVVAVARLSIGSRTSAERAGATVVPFRVQERHIIEEALAAFGGNIPRAAAALEIAPSTIYRKRQEWAAADGPSERLSAGQAAAALA